jgi:hypothetical protein
MMKKKDDDDVMWVVGVLPGQFYRDRWLRKQARYR